MHVLVNLGNGDRNLADGNTDLDNYLSSMQVSSIDLRGVPDKERRRHKSSLNKIQRVWLAGKKAIYP